MGFRNYSYRYNKKNNPDSKALGSYYNPYPSGPFEPACIEEIIVFAQNNQSRGYTSLIAYRDDNVLNESKNAAGDYIKRVKWMPAHEEMIKKRYAKMSEKAGKKWFRHSVNNAAFEQIKKHYSLFEVFHEYKE
jgi:hypothetical protein